MTDTALMQQLDFTADDLAANRAGRLSERQTAALRAKRTRSIALGAGILLVMALAATACIFAGIRGSAILLVIGIGLTITSAAITGTFARHWLRLSADLRHESVSAFSGMLERVVKPVNRRIVTYLLRVDGAEFNVDKETFKAFAHEAPYTLYRARYTGTLLSAEAD